MFSENNQISGRQVFRLLTYDFLGMGTLLLPTMLADTAGRDGIFCILAGILSTFLYLKLLRYLLKGMKTSYPDFLKQKCGKICGYVLWGGYFLYFILMASYTAYLFSTLMLNGLVENVSFYLVLLLILLLAFYGRWNRGQGKSVRDTVLVSDDTAFSDVICGMQGGKACLLEPGFYCGWKRSVKRQLLCAFLLFHGVNRTVSERICCGS